ncbi:hypothetical protein QJS10_CPA16g00513 [Acorus calamus]|uniref:Uncharacterized protein n=1 Tax=Acorus calamus TaxID=4465 RepID=A0AAV9D1E0_ACOCL|nr:hypothetical protein QJS10_CPA16g00513 [Acorus calamus]
MARGIIEVAGVVDEEDEVKVVVSGANSQDSSMVVSQPAIFLSLGKPRRNDFFYLFISNSVSFIGLLGEVLVFFLLFYSNSASLHWLIGKVVG